MARKSKEFERLPSWELRLTIWIEKLKLDMYDRGVVDNLDSTITQFHNDISGVVGIPDDAKTFSNWINKEHYPTENNIDDLLRASSFSGKWLKTDKCSERLHCFLNALDYYLCSVIPEIQPALFKRDEQDSFAEQCLNDIGKNWRIPFSVEEQGQSRVQDVSLSMLQTHGSSAIPFYLCSLASNGDISDDEYFNWYIDLLCSTLVISANYYRENIKIDFGYQERFTNKIEHLGTNPNLLASIGEFLLWPDLMPMLLFKNASYDDFNEIRDSAKLLECILLGNIGLREKLNDVNVRYSEITELVISKLSTSDKSHKMFIPRVPIDKINSIRPFPEPLGWKNVDMIVYHLYPAEPTRVEKKTITRSGHMISELLSCRCPDKANDNHYSWGYGGTGVYNMAYTLLYDLFNHEKFEIDKYIPNRSQMELLVYKLLSRIYLCFQYSISAEQIIDTLKEPILAEPRELELEIVLEFSTCVNGLN